MKAIVSRDICERLPKNGWTAPTKSKHVQNNGTILPAPTAHELFDVLPTGIVVTKLHSFYKATYQATDTIGYFKIADTLEDTLALMWLIINGEYSKYNEAH